MITNLIARLVDFSRRHAWAIVLASLLASGVLGWFVSTHFKINTDVNQLLSSDLPWRQREGEMEKAFPQKVDVILAVIDGDTPDAAENAASALTTKLRSMPERFTYVERPDHIPFFLKNGLLFLSQDESSNILEQLIQAQPLLGSLAADPSLRGLFGMLNLELQGLEHGALDYKQVDKPFTAIADSIDAALAGQDKPVDWQSLMSTTKPGLRDLRKLIVLKPVLNYDELEPGKQATDLIRSTAWDMGITPERGAHLRLTGSVPLNDEEFASVAEGTSFATILSGVLVIVILLLALRSPRLIIPIILTLVVGLITTTAIALAVVKSLSLISIAFAVMFIGIAVDFGIQFGVRYRDQHHQEPNHAKALNRTARIVAVPLAMAGGSTALGFLSFIPTAYRGVSELGFIAGVGMIIAFVLSVTLLPSLLSIFHPPAEPEAVGFSWMRPADKFISKHRKGILICALFAAIVGGLVATKVRFDFDPLDLKDPSTQSVSTLFDLMKDPDFNTYTIDILRPSLTEADKLAEQIRKLPEVDHVMTLTSFVPEDQEKRIAAINDTQTLLGPTLTPTTVQKAPSDEEIYGVFSKTAEKLHAVGKDHESAERLAKALDTVVSKRDHPLLQQLNTDLVAGMVSKLNAARTSLDVSPVTVNSITDDLRRDWIARDGKALVQVYPKGNARDYHTLIAFTDSVQKIAPDAGGSPISIRESGRTVVSAFAHAGCYALAIISLLALVILRRPRDVAMLIAPLILAGILTLATIVVIDLPLNFANIIALPLLLSLGVSYAIYFVSYWRSGLSQPLQSSMARAVLFSAATTLVAFGTLGLSSHPGTASMGELLTVALLYSLTCTFFILPALLGRHKADRHNG